MTQFPECLYEDEYEITDGEEIVVWECDSFETAAEQFLEAFMEDSDSEKTLWIRKVGSGQIKKFNYDIIIEPEFIKTSEMSVKKWPKIKK